MPSSPARTCCTASGCGARTGGSTRAPELTTAHDLFSAMGMAGFAERAGRELAATGETVRKRSVETRDDLTAQEAQIARLARDGLSNPEIGAAAVHQRPHRRVAPAQGLPKLGISSRRQLRAALSDHGLLAADA